MIKICKRCSDEFVITNNRAKTKGLDFDLNHDFLLDLWTLQGGRCAISGRILDLNPYGYKGQVNPNAPSIDRVVPNKGYTKNNIRFVCYQVNVALSEFGDEALKQLCKDIIAFKG